ncbi:hypothetical protein [Pseudomonas fluorescens]|uniref:Uncharacterized protein n=1 Tax=Pseudomonas fluorescens TaxID=294 RepID=A0A0F4VDA8_PSEFL|nr:hypothetical protein [Pseudomonas fluorescens]KJZ66823.1 hypothetical protein VD17_05470 [Pseudomonas fluorescens]
MPSLGEAPNGGAGALGYLGLGGIPYFQVTRCKSETANRHYRRNGFVLDQKNIDRRPSRHRKKNPASNANRVFSGSSETTINHQDQWL